MKRTEIVIGPGQTLLPKLPKSVYGHYELYIVGTTLRIKRAEPVRPKKQGWLFEPGGEEALKKVQKALKQKTSKYLGSFKKYAKKK